jgi:hypothetical protein
MEYVPGYHGSRTNMIWVFIPEKKVRTSSSNYILKDLKDSNMLRLADFLLTAAAALLLVCLQWENTQL